MKKILSVIIASFVLLSTVSVFAVSSKELVVKVNNEKIETDILPVIENDRTLIPVRPLIEALGGQVIMWDQETKTVHAQSENGIVFSLQVGTKSLFINNEAVQLDTAAKIIDGQTFVPLRAICENLGYEVTWHGETRSVTIVK